MTNNRKFRIWDSKTIFSGLEHCINIKHGIDEAAGQHLVPEDLPASLIPTDIVYDIVSAYIGMYEKLLEEDLVVSLNKHKQNRKIH